MGDLAQDLRHGLRILARQPGFTAVAILTLALGIGANTAIFSLVHAVVLRPLPYPEPGRLVAVWSANPEQGLLRGQVSYPTFWDWKKGNSVFERLALVRDRRFTLAGERGAERISGAVVTEDFFPALGVQPALGRMFRSDDDEAGATPVAILGHDLWQGRFGGDPELVGRQVTLDHQSTQVIGILPAGFHFPFQVSEAQVWTPAARDGQLLTQRGMRVGMVLGRLAAGVTLAQARTEMKLLFSRLQAEHPRVMQGQEIHLLSLHEDLVVDVRTAMLILLGVVGSVLLIACANVANLLLARGTSRRREFAIRTALGAGRWRLRRQVLVENMLLGTAGGTAGFLLALWGVSFIRLAPLSLPRVADVSLDGWVLGFTAGVSVLAALLFGLAPALQASRLDVYSWLKEGSRGMAGPGRSRLRGTLVVGEMALALMLFVGAGLLARSFLGLVQVEPGFRTENILTFQALPSGPRYETLDAQADFHGQLLESLRGLPDVQAVGASTTLPLSGGSWQSVFWIEGREGTYPGEEVLFQFNAVTPDYFQVVGIPLQQGRFLSENDRRGKPGAILINETMARRFWPNDDPLGGNVKLGISFAGAPERYRIVGIVADVRHAGLDAEIIPQIYVSYRQQTTSAMHYVVRTGGDPLALAQAVRSQAAGLDPDVPVFQLASMEHYFQRQVVNHRVALWALGAFAVLAVALAAIGLYGVISFLTAQRTHEVGIRMALGAQGHHILRSVVGQGMALALRGMALGLLGAWALTRVLSSWLFHVTATDPQTFAFVAALMAAVALFACYLPARRAMRVDPMTALRHE